MPGDRLRIASAQLPAFEHSDDKVFTTDKAVIVLDGASAFRPVQVPASEYATTLGEHLQHRLQARPTADLRELLASSISATSEDLALGAGNSPSSTVAIVRIRGDVLDYLVLGDSPIVFPDGVVVDERLDELDLPERRLYQDRLANGHGYGDAHKQLLRDLQDAQAKRRNIDGGYWIAEADPVAASHTLCSARPTAETPWAVLATDGAFNTISQMGGQSWQDVSTRSAAGLEALLQTAQQWEATEDPNGQAMPRAKRHDDKAIAAIRLS